MTTETLTTSEAAARVGLSNQYMRVLLGKGKGPKGTREGKGGRGGGYKFLAEDIDAWDAARVKRAPKGSKKGYTYAELEAIAFGTDNAALPLPSNPELAAATDLIKSMDPLGVEISGEDVDLLGVEISGSGADAFKSLINAVCAAPEFTGMADDHDDE